MGCGASQTQASNIEDLRVVKCDRSTSVIRLHDTPVYACRFVVNGKAVVSGGRGGVLKLWHSESGRLLQNVEGHGGFVLSLAVSPSGGQYVTTSNDNTARVFSLPQEVTPTPSPPDSAQQSRLLSTLAGHTHKVYCSSFSPDGKQLLTSAMDKTLRLWDMETGQSKQELTGHTDSVFTCCHSPASDNLCVSGGDDEIVRLWDMRTGTAEATCTAPKRTIWSVRLNNDESAVLVAGMEGGAGLWDVSGTGAEYSTVYSGPNAPTHQAMFSGDQSHVLACGRDSTLRVWQKDGTKVDTLRGHNGAIFCLDMHGNSLLTSSVDTTVRMWEMPREAAPGLAVDGIDFQFDDAGDDPWNLDSPKAPGGRRLTDPLGAGHA